MLTFDLNEGSQEVNFFFKLIKFFFDHISVIPSIIKIAFVVSDESTRFDFHIIDPNEEVIFEKESNIHLFYQFNATIEGEYKYIVDNKDYSDKKRITFAIHQGKSINTNVSHENLSKIWNKLKNINNIVKSSRFTARILSKKYDSRYDLTKKHNKNIVILSIVETAIMMMIFFFQLFYIKQLRNKFNI